MTAGLLSETKRGFAWAIEFYYVIFVVFPFLVAGSKLLGWLNDIDEAHAERAERLLRPVADAVSAPLNSTSE